MSMIWSGLLLMIVGKVLKIKIIDTIGYIMVIAGIVLWGLSLIGISLPIMLPF